MSTTYSDYLVQLKEYITSGDSSIVDNNNNNKEFKNIFNYINPDDGSVDLLDLNNDINYNNISSNISLSNIMKSFILNTSYYDNNEQINNNEYNFFNKNKPWAIYFAEDYNKQNNILYDCSGNGRHATTRGTINKIINEGSPTYITGNINSSIDFPNGSIPQIFTIASITRYESGINNRILQGQTTDWYHGHNNNNVGVCKYGSILKTDQTTISNKEWIRMIGKNISDSNNKENTILHDGVGIAINNDGYGNDILTINNSSIITTGNNGSNWSLCCVIIWDKNLNDNDCKLLDDILKKYMENNILKSSLLIQNTNLIKTSSLLLNDNNLSQVSLKYIFLFDVLTNLYLQISKLNKNDILILLRKGIKITTNIGARKDDNNLRLYYDSRIQVTIKTNDLYNYKKITNYVNSANPIINNNISGYEALFNLIKSDLMKHLYFIINYDMFQIEIYYYYYLLCYNIFKYNINVNKHISSKIQIPYTTDNNILFQNIIRDITYINNKLNSITSLDESSNIIINNMKNISSLNTKLKKINSNISVQSNKNKTYKNIITNTNYIDLISITILIIIIISSIYLQITDNKKSLLIYNIIILIILVLVFIFIYVYLIYYYNINENFVDLSIIPIQIFSNTFKNIILAFKRKNISIINNVTKKSINKEKNKYNSLINIYNNYNKYAIDNNEISVVDHVKKVNKIIFIFIISLLILLINISYIYNYYILCIIIIILIIIIIIIYYYYDNNIYVNTQSNKYYWKKPNNSLTNI